MNLGNASFYLILCGLFFLYLVFSSKKQEEKKKAPAAPVLRRPPAREAKVLPPPSPLFSENIVSQEMQKYADQAVPSAPSSRQNPSRAKCLLKQKHSLRQAILLKEILSRPFE